MLQLEVAGTFDAYEAVSAYDALTAFAIYEAV
jgi:hypothetical protein